MTRGNRRMCLRQDKPAKHQPQLSYEGVTYRLDLCDQHSQECSRIISGWTFVAEEIDEDTAETPLIGECDRCTWIAKVRKHVGWDGDHYILRLCEKHADALLVDILTWMRLGEQVSDQLIPRIRPLTRPTSTVDETAPSIPVPDTEDAENAEAHLPEQTDEWRMSRHAQERLQQRGPTSGFDARDVMLACVAPESIEPSVVTGVWLHRRGNVIATVQREHKLVLTVYGSEDPSYTEQSALQEA